VELLARQEAPRELCLEHRARQRDQAAAAVPGRRDEPRDHLGSRLQARPDPRRGAAWCDCSKGDRLRLHLNLWSEATTTGLARPPLVLVIDHEKRNFRMERGLYIAASGMLAEQVRQDQIANDLARL
jgi:hypothetical protein